MMNRLMLIGSYPLERVGDSFYAPSNYLKYWQNLTNYYEQIYFHAHVWNVKISQYKTKLDTNRIHVFPLKYLSTPHSERSWKDFVLDQKLILTHAKDVDGWIESFPALGGMLSPLYYAKFSARRVVYLKIDWNEQLRLRGRRKGTGFLIKDSLKKLYYRWSQIIAVRQADFTLVRGQDLLNKYYRCANRIELSRPIASFTAECAFKREDTCERKEICILYVGDLCQRKRPLDLVNGVALAANKFPQYQFQVIFVGKEHDNLSERVTQSEIKQLAVDLGLGSQVKCVGLINNSIALSNYYRGADIFVLPSSAEGFPRVVNEALLHSLPVITTPVGGIGLELKNEKHALFVPVGQPDIIADALGRLLTDTTLRRKLIREGYNWGVEQVSEPAWKQHVRVLQKY